MKMKSTVLSMLVTASLLAFPALADAPNRTIQTFNQFVEASGCVVVDKGGYSNLAAKDGGNCPSSVIQAFTGIGHKNITVAGADGVIGTADDETMSVSDN